jgi:hypothetical protein
VYAYSRARVVLTAVVAAGASAGLVWMGWRYSAFLAYYLAGVLLLALLLMRRFIRAPFLPSNWLLRLTDDGLFIQFRSYLNFHFPVEDASVVYIPFREIRSARRVRYRDMLPDERRTYTRIDSGVRVELHLAGPSEPLARALAVEAVKPGPAEQHWYGTSSRRYNHAPVRMPSAGRLQLDWRVAPSAQAFLNAISPCTDIAAPTSRSLDYSELKGMRREQQEQRLLQLAQAGQKIAAIKIARELYGYDLTQGRAFVEDLVGKRE